MKVRNKTEAPIQFMVRTNAGEMVTLRDQKGNEYKEEAMPKLQHIYIPAAAEVELDDKVWEAMMATKTTVQKYEEEFGEFEQFDEKTLYKRRTLLPTGVFQEINLIKQRVDSGDLVVTEKAKSTLTVQEKAKKLLDMNIPITKDSHTAEEIEVLYSKIFG